MAHEITYNNFEISIVVFIPNITINHAITYTNFVYYQINSILHFICNLNNNFLFITCTRNIASLCSQNLVSFLVMRTVK